MDIPADATAIHGITTEQARREGRPAADVAAEVAALLGEVWTATTPLCAFKADFDLTMLNAELQRHHGHSLPLSGPVIDPRCIDLHIDPYRAGTRRLGDMCGHYQLKFGAPRTPRSANAGKPRGLLKVDTHLPRSPYATSRFRPLC